MLAALLLSAALSADHTMYASAYKIAVQENRPLVVLVGATWCPGCVTMKNTMEDMREAGKLDDVLYVYLDFDADPVFARQFMVGPSIPVMAVYKRNAKGELRRTWHCVGATSAKNVSAAIGDRP